MQSLVRHARPANDHAVALMADRNDLLVFAMPFDLLGNHWSDDHDASRWRRFDYAPRSGPIIQLSRPEMPPIGEGETLEVPDGRLWDLAMHVFTPTWKYRTSGVSESEMFLIGYSQCRGTYNRMLVSYRVNLTFPRSRRDGGSENERAAEGDVTITQVDTASALATSIPWNSGRSVFNSGHIILMRKPLRCFSLFTGVRQPIREFEAEGTPLGGEDTAAFAAVIDPWTGTIVCMTDTSLFTYLIE